MDQRMVVGITVTALGTVIGGLVLQHFGILYKIWIWIVDIVLGFLHIMLSDIAIPLWAVIILVLISFFVAIEIVRRVFQRRPEPGYTKYTEDYFFNSRWRWSWKN